MTVLYVFLFFFILAFIGHYDVNYRKNSYESIYGAALFIGSIGCVVTGWVGLGIAIYELFQL